MHLILAECPQANGLALTPMIRHLGYVMPAEALHQRWLETAQGLTGAVSRPSARGEIHHQEFLAGLDRPALIDVRENGALIEPLLGADAQAHLLLVYRHPELSLASALAMGARPSEAQHRWQTVTASLLEVIRRHRSRCLVVDIDQARIAPNLFLRACEERLKMRFQPWTLEPAPAEAPSGPLYSVLARQLVAESVAIKDQLGELEATALAIGTPVTTTVDIDAAWAESAALAQRSRSEIDALEARHRVDSEVQEERHRSEIKALQDRLKEAATSAPVAATETDCERVKRELDDAMSENELLLTQLHQVQEELEHYFLQAQQRSQVTIDCSRAQAKLERMERTLSWRLTAPLRWGFRPFKRRLSKKR